MAAERGQDKNGEEQRNQIGAVTASRPGGLLRLCQYGGYTVEYERAWAKPIREVWNTMTDPSRMIDWYAEAELEPHAGGKIVLRFANNGAVCIGIITEFEPPIVFEHMWVTGRMTRPAQPMPKRLADEGYTCGDLNTAASIVRWELTAQDENNTALAVSHYIPMNPRLIGPAMRKSAPAHISVSPAPDMVMASWECLLHLLDQALSHPGNRAMSLRQAERAGDWPWDRHKEVRRKYATVVAG
jgi:uncharacterized protein YndB with AHSA1/START domain